MKKITLFSLITSLVLLAGCASFNTKVKDFESATKGLNRTVYVYSTENGELLHQYEGKIRVQPSEIQGKVLFEVDGKRVIIHNAIVVIEEK